MITHDVFFNHSLVKMILFENYIYNRKMRVCIYVTRLITRPTDYVSLKTEKNISKDFFLYWNEEHSRDPKQRLGKANFFLCWKTLKEYYKIHNFSCWGVNQLLTTSFYPVVKVIANFRRHTTTSDKKRSTSVPSVINWQHQIGFIN